MPVLYDKCLSVMLICRRPVQQIFRLMWIRITMISGNFHCGIRKFAFIILLTVFIFHSLIYIIILNNTKQFPFMRNYSLCTYDKLGEALTSETSWINFLNQLKFVGENSFSRIKLLDLFKSFIFVYYPNHVLVQNTAPYLDLKIQYTIDHDKHTTDHFNDDYVMTKANYINHPVPNKNEKESRVYLKEHNPKYFNVSQCLQAMSKGLSNNEVPNNNQPSIVLQLPKRACNPCSNNKKLDLVVIVKSCAYCFEQRSYARSTYMNKQLWNNFSVEFMFTVGLPVPNETNIFQFDGFTTSLTLNSWQLSNRYEASKWSAAKALYNESKHYNDLLIGGFYDTYYNLTTKMILSFRWASAFCIKHTPLFFFVDDDYYLYPNNVMKLIKTLNTSEMKSLAAGSVYFGRVDRPYNRYGDRWALSTSEYPWDYFPRYFLGIGYFLGADVVHDASIAMAFTKHLRIDDAYFGIILKRLNRSLTHLTNIHIHPYKEQLTSGAIIITKYLAENYVNWTTGLIKEDKKKRK